jgi:hypothetical protein
MDGHARELPPPVELLERLRVHPDRDPDGVLVDEALRRRGGEDLPVHAERGALEVGLLRGAGEREGDGAGFLQRHRIVSSRGRSMGSLVFPHSIVVAGLEKLDAVLEDFVDESVGLSDPARPHVATEILERLRLAEPLEGVAQHGLHEVEHA